MDVDEGFAFESHTNLKRKRDEESAWELDSLRRNLTNSPISFQHHNNSVSLMRHNMNFNSTGRATSNSTGNLGCSGLGSSGSSAGFRLSAQTVGETRPTYDYHEHLQQQKEQQQQQQQRQHELQQHRHRSEHHLYQQQQQRGQRSRAPVQHKQSKHQQSIQQLINSSRDSGGAKRRKFRPVIFVRGLDRKLHTLYFEQEQQNSASRSCIDHDDNMKIKESGNSSGSTTRSSDNSEFNADGILVSAILDLFEELTAVSRNNVRLLQGKHALGDQDRVQVGAKLQLAHQVVMNGTNKEDVAFTFV